MAKKKRKYKFPPGFELPPGVGMNLRPKVAVRLVELLRIGENLNDQQIAARMKSERLKVSQTTVFRFREAMGIRARGKLALATIERANELIEKDIFNALQITKIMKQEGHKISIGGVRALIKEKKKSPLGKALDTGNFRIVAKVIEKMNPEDRLVNFKVAAETRAKLEHMLSSAKKDSNRYRLLRNFNRTNLLIKALALFLPRAVLEEYLKKYGPK